MAGIFRLFLIVLVASIFVFLALFLGRGYLTGVVLDNANFAIERFEVREIIAPKPLRGIIGNAENSHLTVLGIFRETNRHRTEAGLPALTLNASLSFAADMKVNDMLEKQYFDHVSPDGIGAGELIHDAGYEYLVIGENLAMGNYKNDEALVRAWMESPGHRENILHPRFTEIGISVARDVFEGNNTWLSVQEFAAPLSLCPGPDEAEKLALEKLTQELDQLRTDLEMRKQELDDAEPKRGAEYRKRVNEYNDLVVQYNELFEDVRRRVEEFNVDVRAFNACVNSST